MRILLDTHTLLWWFDGDKRLPIRLRRVIESEETDIFVSAATGWEIATKARLGKLPQAMPIARRLSDAVLEQGFRPLPITLEHGQRAGWFSTPHRDPFDRMLAAQSQAESMPLATNDKAMAGFGIELMW